MIDELKKTIENKMHKSIDALKADLSKIRTGRAHAGILDHVMVDYYGSSMPIPQIGNVTLLDARTIGVVPWEKKMIQTVEKAIRDSDLGLNPAAQGGLIRVPIPALTEERRRDLVKVMHKLGEEGRVAVRHARGEAHAKIKKLEKIAEDDKTRGEKDLQKLTDEHIKQIDALIAAKEAEIMEV